MQPIGKNYLVKMEHKRDQQINGIFVPDVSQYQSIPYIGYIESAGPLVKNPLVQGTKVICNYKTNDRNSTKLMLGDQLYYIYNENDIIGIIEE